jgi:hypothetical protein
MSCHKFRLHPPKLTFRLSRPHCLRKALAGAVSFIQTRLKGRISEDFVLSIIDIINKGTHPPYLRTQLLGTIRSRFVPRLVGGFHAIFVLFKVFKKNYSPFSGRVDLLIFLSHFLPSLFND